jgi:hypothetical protein
MSVRCWNCSAVNERCFICGVELDDAPTASVGADYPDGTCDVCEPLLASLRAPGEPLTRGKAIEALESLPLRGPEDGVVWRDAWALVDALFPILSEPEREDDK